MTTFNSNIFTVTVTAQSQFESVAASTAAGTFSSPLTIEGLTGLQPRLDPRIPSGTEYPDCAGGTAAAGYTETRAWIWVSRAVMDVDNNRILGFFSPHPGPEVGNPDNGYLTLLTMIDMNAAVCVIMENPFSATNNWPKCISHGYDNVEIAGNILYKYTSPVWREGLGYVQPQICMVNKNALTLNQASGSMGAAFLGEIPPHLSAEQPLIPNIEAGSMFYLPGPKYMVTYHRTTLYPTDITTPASPVLLPAKTVPIVLPTGQPYAIHNLGHFHPILGKGVFGGGAYSATQNRQFFTVSNTTAMTITELDESPHALSTSETDLPVGAPDGVVSKCCFTWDPRSVESLAFTDRLTILALNPNKPAGQQWRTADTIAAGIGEVDWVCSDPVNQVIWCGFSRSPGGTALIRCYKPAPLP